MVLQSEIPAPAVSVDPITLEIIGGSVESTRIEMELEIDRPKLGTSSRDSPDE